MGYIPIEALRELQKDPTNVRNICILAHVDHGKTTLADSLVAANGIISGRSAGKLRYMDSRSDEQQRGITMKASAIALYFKSKDSKYLVNLIDSPGHVDFCGEVSTATRLSDGALIVVDVVEGVCPQTNAVLRQSWKEGLRPLLVLNKIDRLITEVKMTPAEAYKQLQDVLTQVNAIAGEMFLSDVMEQQEYSQSNGHTLELEKELKELDLEEEDLYFAPEKGNVVFASALDSWGFQISDFAAILSKKSGVKSTVLNRTLWGDFYLDGKAKIVRKGAFNKGKTPMFVQFVLENIWAIYNTLIIDQNGTKGLGMAQKLGLELSHRDKNHKDMKVLLQAIMSQWLNLAVAVLNGVCQQLPSPANVDPERIEKLLYSNARNEDLKKIKSQLPEETKRIENAVKACSSSESVPTVAYVSKMIAVERKHLPQNRKTQLTMEEMRIRKEKVLEKQNLSVRFQETNQVCTYREEDPIKEKRNQSDYVFIGFTRIFSGSLKQGQTIFVLPKNHDPNKEYAADEVKSVVIENLYLMMGRDLEEVPEVPAGSVAGIGGLEDDIFKSGTLSTSLKWVIFLINPERL